VGKNFLARFRRCGSSSRESGAIWGLSGCCVGKKKEGQTHQKGEDKIAKTKRKNSTKSGPPSRKEELASITIKEKERDGNSVLGEERLLKSTVMGGRN